MKCGFVIHTRFQPGDPRKNIFLRTMPCDGAWPREQVTLFKRWTDEGLAP